MRLVVVALALVAVDLQRAKQRVPGSRYRGKDLRAANGVLNAQLRQSGFALARCEDWSVLELRSALRGLFRLADPQLNAQYAQTDGRWLPFSTLDGLEQSWNGTSHGEAVRDAHCHEAIMLFVHHVPDAQKAAVGVLPALPDKTHAGETADHKFYKTRVSCQQCHAGPLDLGDLDNATLPFPLPPYKAQPGLERKRVCDYQYEPKCGACDGLGGKRTGDAVSEFEPLACEDLGMAQDPVKPRYPPMGWAELTGDTREPLAVVPDGKGQYVPMQARILLRWDDQFARQRYDFGTGNETFAQVYIQSHAEQRAGTATQGSAGYTLNIGGGKCSCGKSFAGVMQIDAFVAHEQYDKLDLPASEGGAAYLGRVRVPHLGQNRTCDHYMKWAFHFLVDADPTSEDFGHPVRLYGPYGVRQEFGEWHIGDPGQELFEIPAGCKRDPACPKPEHVLV